MKKYLLMTTGLATGLLAGGLYASRALAETELEEIVVFSKNVGANFIDTTVMGGQDLLTTPTTVNVIDTERFNLDTVNFTEDTQELLNRVPGMSGSRNLRVDCGWCDYTVNLQNGVAVESFGGGSYNFDSANNFDIGRIEIIKGPASALYPSNAFGGVIDVITRKPPREPRVKLFGDIGSWGRKRGGFALGGTYKGLGFSMTGFEYKLRGWREGRREKKRSGSVRLSYELSPATSLEVGGSMTHEYTESVGDLTQAQWDADWGMVPTSFDWATRTLVKDISIQREDTKTADASFKHIFSDSLKMKVSYGFVHSKSESQWGDSKDDRHDLKPRLTKEFGFWKSRLITGADFAYDESERLGAAGTLTKTTIISPYAQYEFSPFTQLDLLEPLKFTLGARYETFNYDYTKKVGAGGEKKIRKFTPHLGATYKLNNNNSVFVSYSEGISPPGASRMFPASPDWRGDVYLSNSDLKPEQARNWEIGFRGSVLDSKFTYDIAYHDLQIADFIISEEVAAGVYQYRNVGGVSIRGIEAQLAAWPVKWAGVEMAYTYGIHKFTDYITADGTDYSGNYMRRSMKHRLNTRFIAKPIKGAKVELEWDYNSAAFINYDNSDTYKRPDLFHLSASYQWRDMITVWGQVRNLTNVKYANRVTADDAADGGAREYEAGLPRSWALGLSAKVKF